MKRANLFILGKGGVGGAFLRLLPILQNKLKETEVELKLIGAADINYFLLDENGIKPDFDFSSEPGAVANPGLDEIGKKLKDVRNLIAADLTAEDTARFFAELLSSGASVVTCNKKPLSAPRDIYAKLRPYANKQLRYECAVGGGLPIISTINRLLNSGDEILLMRGLFSGTLGFIMSKIFSGAAFSEAVREAHALRYTEPDPRDDLSGADVRRKALILARIVGAEIDLDQVASETLVPEELRQVPVKEFLEGIQECDRLYKPGEKTAYVATVTSSGAKIGLEAIAPDDLLSSLTGPENMIVIKTRKYCQNPLVIRGPGAGVEVTAQGVIGDILRVVGAL